MRRLWAARRWRRVVTLHTLTLTLSLTLALTLYF
jgi:hypothetical protein